MSRIRYGEFRQADSTLLFNDRNRGILLAGVYKGFAVSSGTLGGLNLKLTHETDPDNTGSVLGKLITHDGVTIGEDADQDNSIIGSVSAGTPNIHFVVADYQYNDSLPNNDVVYAVIQGTSGAVPTPPVLTDNQVLLAKIYLPSGASAYNGSGVIIENVAKKSLYETDNLLVSKNLTGILKPGIYQGISTYKGSTALAVSIAAGTWVTNENFQVTEAAVLADELTISDPGTNQYAWCWVIGAHKFAESNPYPSADYILVQGTAATNGTSAAYPTDTQIRTAVAAAYSKYDTNNDALAETTYVNKLGLIRVQKDASGTLSINYIRGESLLDDSTLIVSGATSSSEYRSSAYYGAAGFEAALTRAAELSVLNLGTTQIPIGIDGSVNLRDAVHRVPSNVRLFGLNQQSQLLSNASNPIEVEGLAVTHDGTNNTITNPATTGSYTPPSGYVSRLLTFNTTNYTTEFANLSDKKFCRGDRIILKDASSSVQYAAIFVAQTATYSIDVFVETQYATDGNAADLTINIIKSRVSIDRLEIKSDVSGTGIVSIKGCEKCHFDNLKVTYLSVDDQIDNVYGFVETDKLLWNSGAYPMIGNTRNEIGHLRILDTASGTVSLATGSTFLKAGIVERISPVSITAELAFLGTKAEVGVLRNYGNPVTSFVSLNGASDTKVGSIETNSGVKFTTCSDSLVDKIVTGSSYGIEFVSGTRNIVNKAIVGTAGVVHTTLGSVVMFSSGASDVSQVAEHHNEDRNLRVVSDATITWNSDTGLLSWSSDIRFDIPWQTGYTQVVAGSVSLTTDGDRAILDINRDATGASAATVSARTKANAALDRFSQNRVYLAVRYGTNIYMFDGTRIENGQTVKLGATPPTDGSVTYSKLASSIGGSPIAATDPLTFLNKYFRDYCPSVDNVGWDSEMYFINTSNVTFTYTAATGVIQYASNVDLAAAVVAFNEGAPLWFMFREVDFVPSAGFRCHRKEQIIDIDDTANTVTILASYDTTVGSGHRWNGCIGRGPVLVPNTNLTSYTLTATGADKGKITFVSPYGFSANQVMPGHVFVDSSNNKFVIYDRDSSGAGAWVRVAIDGRGIDTAAPTTTTHGSIEENNNPFDLVLANMSVLAGQEFVPVDLPGQDAGSTRSSELVKVNSSSTPHASTDQYNRRFTIPHDERITCMTIPTAGSLLGSIPGDYTGNTSLSYGNNGMVILEVTAVCTGMILVTNGNGVVSGTAIQVDGVDQGHSWFYSQDGIDVSYGVSQNRFEPMIDDYYGSTPTITRLVQGIHTFRFIFANAVSIRAVRGVLILNEPPTNSSSSVFVSDSPGTLVQKGGVRKYLLPNCRVSTPTNPSTFDKGGRLVRYVDYLGTRSWATRYIRSFSGTGNVSNGSADITAVSNVASWAVGDLVLIRGASGVKYISQILSIAGSTITTNTAWPTTSAAITFHYYGRTIKSLSYTATSGLIVRSHSRVDEEVAMLLPSVNDFPASGALVLNRGGHGDGGTLSSSARGVRLSDATTGLGTSGATRYQAEGSLRAETNGIIIRIVFVGTGLSIFGSFASDTTLKIDGASCGTLFSMAASGEMPQDSGLFICGDLPYGSHVVDIVRGASNNFVLRGATVYQPKKPTVADGSVELWDSNYLGHSDSSFPEGAFTEVNTTNAFQLGVINLSALETYNGIAGSNIITDGLSGITDAHTLASVGTYGGVGTTNAKFVFNVLGDEFKLYSGFMAVVGSVVDITVLGNDGLYRSPSAMSASAGGFTVTGPDSITVDVFGITGFRLLMSKHVHTAVVMTLSGDNMVVDASSYDTHPKFHAYKSRLPSTIDHWLPYQNGGLDIRNTTPLSSTSESSSRVHLQHAAINYPGTFLNEFSRRPFIFYSRGGYCKLSVTAVANNSANASFYIEIAIDGNWSVFNSKEHQSNAAGQDIGVSLEKLVYLPAGFHTAHLVSENTFDTTFSKQIWVCENVISHHNGSPSRIDAPPVNGSSSPNYRNY